MNPAMRATLEGAFACDVADGLLGTGAKHLPPIWFYDARGSELFERITETPEYYLTRTERALLEADAPAMVALDAAAPVTLVELGAGSGVKTRLLIDALLARQGRLTYQPIDVSQGALDAAREGLRGVAGLRVRPVHGRNRPALRKLPRDGPRLVLFLGSSIGNYEPGEAARFLEDVGSSLAPGDALLLGTDMVKDPAVLDRAYNDAAGWNAAFNKNVLVRINRELGGAFDLDRFAHRAFFNPEASRVEMHLESLLAQRVPIASLGAEAVFAAGERIHTENSYKYTPASVRALAHEAGLGLERSWYAPDAWFGLHRLAPA